ncbi:MAG: pyruvate dehydrogenase (acetyl-transferring), homodimeric type, partial [Chloroflexota bacterium]
EREASTTMVFVRMLAALMRDAEQGKRVVPIVPDEARTFGMETFFREFGIYSSKGQNYDPVDGESLLYYKESLDGQVIEEGITEAGSFSSFLAAGTSNATYGSTTIPFFIFYSMFGMQRVGDLVWAAADARARGFLIGGTAGRTTLNGEGLQHADGHSLVLASVVPAVRSYDPAYAYEIAVLLRDGIQRMYVDLEDCMYYITVGNENYVQPPMPEGDDVREGIVRGIYKFRSVTPAGADDAPRVHLLGSGSILNEAVEAQRILAADYGVASDVWSVTSYTELRRDGIEVDRWNQLHPGEPPRVPYVVQQLGGTHPIVAASDYLKSLPDAIAKWLDTSFTSLGTDGFGRSASREELRDFFEVDARHIAFAAISSLVREELLPVSVAQRAVEQLGIETERPNPATTI